MTAKPAARTPYNDSIEAYEEAQEQHDADRALIAQLTAALKDIVVYARCDYMGKVEETARVALAKVQS